LLFLTGRTLGNGWRQTIAGHEMRARLDNTASLP